MHWLSKITSPLNASHTWRTAAFLIWRDKVWSISFDIDMKHEEMVSYTKNCDDHPCKSSSCLDNLRCWNRSTYVYLGLRLFAARFSARNLHSHSSRCSQHHPINREVYCSVFQISNWRPTITVFANRHTEICRGMNVEYAGGLEKHFLDREKGNIKLNIQELRGKSARHLKKDIFFHED